jgi:hypothetical protein
MDFSIKPKPIRDIHVPTTNGLRIPLGFEIQIGGLLEALALAFSTKPKVL